MQDDLAPDQPVPDDAVREALYAWRGGLADRTRGNRLLNLPRNADDSTLEISGPSPKSIVKVLQEGGEFGFLGTDAPDIPRPTHLLRVKMPDERLGGIMQGIARRSHQEMLDRGLSTLYLAMGVLNWSDAAGISYQSPILLLPAECDGERLAPTGDDPMINPALGELLAPLGVQLPPVAALADLDVTVLWARIDVAIGEHRDWHADETTVLSWFPVHREDAYGDLLANEAQIAEHPVVRALATLDAGHRFAFKPIAPAVVDEQAPPEDVPLVLDADADQRTCVAAALAGHSFVIDGPPGTGKTQTIANMVGALLHAGKRVLVVSEKAAALEMIERRLGEAGLGNYLLGLHDELIGRRELAGALAQALETDPIPLAMMDPIDRRAVRERRERLTAYAQAMNVVRKPLGRSLHDVLGICARLAEVPGAPAAESDPALLTPEALDEVREALTRLGQVGGDTYTWRDATRREPMVRELRQALSALGSLAAAVAANGTIANAYDLHEPAHAGTLAKLAAHASARPAKINEDWLTIADFAPARKAATELGGHLAALRYGGIPWSELPSAADLADVPDLSGLDPVAVELGPLNAAQAEHLANRFTDDADRLEQHQESLDRVTARLGLPNVVTFPDSARVIAIGELIKREQKPEAAWFDPGGLAKAHAAARAIRRAVEAVQAAEETARQHFNEGVLKEPIDELAERFATRHRGPRKLLRTYRKDKKAAAEVALPTVSTGQAVGKLDDAAAWKQAADELTAAEAEYADILGRHYNAADTDWAGLQEALHNADEVIRETPAEALPAVAVHVSAPRPNSALLRIVGEARDEFSRWRNTLKPEPARAGRPELWDGPIQEAVRWLRAHVGPLGAAAELIRAFSEPTGRDLTLAEASGIAAQRQNAVEAEAAIWSSAGTHAALLGSMYRGTKTNDEALAETVAWTTTARTLLTSDDAPLTAEQAQALAENEPSVELPGAVQDWEDARQVILDAFGPVRRVEVAARLGDYDTARDLMLELMHDATGQDDWFVHQDAREVLVGLGLEAAVEFCARESIEPEQMWPIIERALYRGWADAIIAADSGLQPAAPEERDLLVETYRLLDHELIEAAPADIVHIVEARRPSTSATGEPEMIRREGLKKGGHLGVRELLTQARHAAQALKPCFLMSPLAVGRLLPPEIEFDVVIVDEASQLEPAAAMASVYRGSALITAGDEQQLAATGFHDHYRDDVTDHPSLFELASASFPVIPLTWHHSGLHQDLFGFAGQAYYDDKVRNLPRADAGEPGYGLELFAVEGVFQRETTADNPIEAAAVAERVINHYLTRPDQTLGVVAFTLSQAAAISAAVTAAVKDQPEIAGLMRENDRLDGFFVKSVEAVQGDARDVIILSVGYGYDENDKISTNFGALTRPKGWRRLNVATTRARRLMEIVTSLRAQDVPEVGSETLRHLKAYLDFAERGPVALGQETSRATGTLLEDAVHDSVKAWGIPIGRPAAHTGVDLAVPHPAYDEGVWALGIQLDDGSYLAVPATRDRDRLVPEALRERGWTLHRVWSTAWYHDHAEQEHRLLDAIQNAVRRPAPEIHEPLELPKTHHPASKPQRTITRGLVDRESPTPQPAVVASVAAEAGMALPTPAPGSDWDDDEPGDGFAHAHILWGEDSIFLQDDDD